VNRRNRQNSRIEETALTGALNGASQRRFMAYLWVLPVTALGLAVSGLTILTGGNTRVVSGVLEAWGGFAAWLLGRVLRRRVSCATLGHVIIGLNAEYLDRARAHERVHVRQYEKWGLLFVPLYLGSSLMAWARGKHYYRDNAFEREAYERAS
jgi:hypothetical protein